MARGKRAAALGGIDDVDTLNHRRLRRDLSGAVSSRGPLRIADLHRGRHEAAQRRRARGTAGALSRRVTQSALEGKRQRQTRRRGTIKRDPEAVLKALAAA